MVGGGDTVMSWKRPFEERGELSLVYPMSLVCLTTLVYLPWGDVDRDFALIAVYM